MSEEQFVRNCAPTLADLKTGSLFTSPFASAEEMRETARSLNRRLNASGLRVLPMRYAQGKGLIYVYRPRRLEADLQSRGAVGLLRRYGYPRGKAGKCVAQLSRRLRESPDFPHEIGLFLGYPPEDVIGFIDNKAKNCKCAGCWKVYGDEKRAKAVFARYHACTRAYCARWSRGCTLESLAVSG